MNYNIYSGDKFIGTVGKNYKGSWWYQFHLPDNTSRIHGQYNTRKIAVQEMIKAIKSIAQPYTDLVTAVDKPLTTRKVK